MPPQQARQSPAFASFGRFGAANPQIESFVLDLDQRACCAEATGGREGERKVRTPKGSAPGNARSG
jgi:hypothetical protein